MTMVMIDNQIGLLDIIGKGAFGNVFLGKNIKTGKYYAIKKISKKLLESETTFQYFNNEVFILKHLNHPNIVRFEDIIEYQSDYYLLTEYCNGGSLKNSLKYYLEKYKKPLPENIVRYFVYNILVGIIYLNRKNLIHRDIKTDNILLHYEKEEDLINHNFLKAKIKIIDFGFARYLEQDELAGSLVGTPMYMEPNLLKTFMTVKSIVVDGFYDKKVDVWSLGVLTYELLIGIVPFFSNNLKGLYECVTQRDFTIPIEKKRDFNLSKSAILFIDKTLNIDINKRPLPELLIKDQWVLGKFNKNMLYKMKTNKEISNNNKKTEFIELWKPINSGQKKILEIVGLSLINPIKVKQLSSLDKKILKKEWLKSDKKIRLHKPNRTDLFTINSRTIKTLKSKHRKKVEDNKKNKLVNFLRKASNNSNNNRKTLIENNSFISSENSIKNNLTLDQDKFFNVFKLNQSPIKIKIKNNYFINNTIFSKKNEVKFGEKTKAFKIKTLQLFKVTSSRNKKASFYKKNFSHNIDAEHNKNDTSNNEGNLYG